MSNTEVSLPESPSTKSGGTDYHSSELIRQELRFILQAAGDGIYGIDCEGNATSQIARHQKPSAGKKSRSLAITSTP